MAKEILHSDLPEPDNIFIDDTYKFEFASEEVIERYKKHKSIYKKLNLSHLFNGFLKLSDHFQNSQYKMLPDEEAIFKGQSDEQGRPSGIVRYIDK